MVIKCRLIMVLASSLALVACASDGDSGPAQTAATPTETVATSARSTDVEVVDSASETADATGTTESAPGSLVPTVATSDEQAPGSVASSGGSGRCSVRITGAVTAEWTSEASGFQAFVYGGWLAKPSAEDRDAFGLNCYDPDFNIVGFSSTPGMPVPMVPGVHDVGSAGDSGVAVQAEVALLFDDGLWESISGTLDISEFDESHISGTFSLTITDSFDTTRSAEVTGEFAHSK